MFEIFQNHPVLIFDMEVNAEAGSGQPLSLLGDLRVMVSPPIDGKAKVNSTVLRVTGPAVWDPGKPVYFEGCTKGEDEDSSVVEIDASTLTLALKISGWHRLPIEEGGLIEDHDFFMPRSFPASASMTITLCPMGKAQDVMSATGAFVISSPGMTPVFGSLRGKVHLYKRQLPGIDKSGKVAGVLYLPIQIFMVRDSSAPKFISRDQQVKTAQRLWGQCGILVEIQDADEEVIMDKKVLNTILSAHDMASIRQEIRAHPKVGKGIPVIFVPKGVPGGGGQTVGHGSSSAMVVLNDQDCGNDTLLAHELGHVLGGKEANACVSSDGFWCDADKTIMDGGETLCEMAPPIFGSSTCDYAKCFAYSRKQRVGILSFLLLRAARFLGHSRD